MLAFIMRCILISIATPGILAAFTSPSSYGLDQLIKLDSGGFCYKPMGRSAFNASCSYKTPAGNFAAIVRVHLGHTSGLSIAYYDAQHHLLGGATWKVPNPLAEPVYICMGGVGYDASAKSLCRFAIADDDFSQPRANAAYCTVNVVSPLVLDGCYEPPVNAQHLASPASCSDDDSSTELSTATTILSTITSLLGDSGLWMFVSCALLYWSKQVRAFGARVRSWLGKLAVFLGREIGRTCSTCFIRPSVLPIHVPVPSSPSTSGAVTPVTAKLVPIRPLSPAFVSRRDVGKSSLILTV